MTLIFMYTGYTGFCLSLSQKYIRILHYPLIEEDKITKVAKKPRNTHEAAAIFDLGAGITNK